MVYPDLNDSLSSQPQIVRNYAGPFSRFLSALLDYFIFFPLVSFVMAILFRDSLSVFVEIMVSEKFTSLVVQIFIFYVLSFTLLQTVFIYWYGATPGQSFLKIYTKFEEQHSNFFFQVWLRQIGFVLSLILLGLPYLAVLYHNKRRTFYDRLSECDILTYAPTEEFYLRDLDKKYIASGVSVALCFLTTTFIISLIQTHYYTVNQFLTSEARVPGLKKCFDITAQTAEKRMQTALALNILEIISDDCVINEADAIFSQNLRKDPQADTLAYYAKYLLAEKSPQSELAVDKDKYLKSACQSDVKSEFCDKADREVASEKDDLKIEFLKKLMKK